MGPVIYAGLEYIRDIKRDIDDEFFVIMFPGDDYGPQHYVMKPEFIKK